MVNNPKFMEMLVHARVVSQLKEYTNDVHKKVTDAIMKSGSMESVVTYEHLDAAINSALLKQLN